MVQLANVSQGCVDKTSQNLARAWGDHSYTRILSQRSDITGAARHGQGGTCAPLPGNVQMGICNPSPEFLTVFVYVAVTVCAVNNMLSRGVVHKNKI